MQVMLKAHMSDPFDLFAPLSDISSIAMYLMLPAERIEDDTF